MRKFLRLAVVVVITVLLITFVVTPVRIVGQSMEPTYHEGGVTLINRLAYLLGGLPTRGDVVAVKFAGPRVMFLKRIIGQPGETVAIKEGVVFINDRQLLEPYLIEPAPWNYSPKVLTADEYFIIGDNRRQSIEEHVFGRISGSQIVGRPLW